MSKTVTVQLSQEIQTHKGPKSEIELKEPLARSFRVHGEAVKVVPYDGDKMIFEYRDGAMLGYLTDMTGLDAVILDSLTANDYIKLRTAATNLIFGIVGEHPTQQ
jgi:hypothetical protein